MDDEYFDDLDEYEYEDELDNWEQVDRKSIPDYDGFTTDYTLWHNWADDTWACILGDNELYNPINTEPDAEFDDEDEAREWFDEYRGFEDEDDDMPLL